MAKTIECDGIKYDLIPQNQDNLRIVILERGFVYVGNFSDNGDTIRIDHARCVRVWGTSRGLAQLANEGIQSGTKLDDETTVEAPKSALIHTLVCEVPKWKK